jgi:transposase-like protein
VFCDGLKGLPESITTTGSFAQAQASILHLIRNTFRYASRKDWDALARDLRPVYTAPNAEMAALRFEDFAATWGARYPAIIKLWRSAWEEFIPFLDYDVEIRKIICSTNAIESLNARYRRAIRARGHFPTDQAALKCLYLVTRSLDPTGRGKTRWALRRKPALNALSSLSKAVSSPASPTNGITDSDSDYLQLHRSSDTPARKSEGKVSGRACIPGGAQRSRVGCGLGVSWRWVRIVGAG